MKVWVIDIFENYNLGQTNKMIKIFDSKEKAEECMKVWKERNKQLVDDIKSEIENGSKDHTIIERDDYFYCYDGINFDSVEITIEHREVL